MSIMERAVKSRDAGMLVSAMKEVFMQADTSSEVSIVLDDKGALEATKTLLQAALAATTSQIAGLSKLAAESQASSTGGETLLEMANVQCFEPRGRFDLKITTTHIVLQGKQFSVLVPVDSVAQVMCLPSFTSAKKEGEDYLAFQFSQAVKINNKDSNQILLNLMRTTNPTTKSNTGDNDLNESAAVIMAVQAATGLHVQRPQASLFATCRDQKPYLKCYRGTQEGAIYPLQCGVVFIKPLLIIPADEIASLSAGRGGGAGNTRYVDLVIESTTEKTNEFTNIDREELPAVQMYVKGYLEARAAQQLKAAARKEKKIKAEHAVVLDGDSPDPVVDLMNAPDGQHAAMAEGGARDLYDSDSSDESDEDYDPDASGSEKGRRRGRKHRRDDDEEEEGDSGGSEDSDDSDADSDDSDDDDSDDSGSDASGSDAESDRDACRKASPVKAKKAANKPSPAKKAKRDEPVEVTKVKKAPAKAPGSSAPRPRPVPGQPMARPASAATPSQAGSAGKVVDGAPKEGRKGGAPVKREAGSAKPRPGASAGAAVKVEKNAMEVVSLDCDAPVVVKVKAEPMEVVDLRVDDTPSAVQVKQEQRAAEVTAKSPVRSPTSVTKSVAIDSSKSAAPAPAVAPAPAPAAKRTIMDMFAAQKKPASAPVAAAAAPEKVADLTEV